MYFFEIQDLTGTNTHRERICGTGVSIILSRTEIGPIFKAGLFWITMLMDNHFLNWTYRHQLF